MNRQVHNLQPWEILRQQRKSTRLDKLPKRKTILPNAPSSSSSTLQQVTEGSISYRDASTIEATYFIKNIQEIVLHLNQQDIHLMDTPWQIQEKYFEHHMFPIKSKSHYVYVAILISLNSVKIEYFRQNPKDLNSEITYSKLTITNLITPQLWGLHPNRERTIFSRDKAKIATIHIGNMLMPF